MNLDINKSSAGILLSPIMLIFEITEFYILLFMLLVADILDKQGWFGK